MKNATDEKDCRTKKNLRRGKWNSRAVNPFIQELQNVNCSIIQKMKQGGERSSVK